MRRGFGKRPDGNLSNARVADDAALAARQRVRETRIDTRIPPAFPADPFRGTGPVRRIDRNAAT